MARTREQIDAEVRQRTPEIVVTDGAKREVFRPGDARYEATIADWTDAHLAAEQEIEQEDQRRAPFVALLPAWEQGTPEQRALAYLLRRAGVEPEPAGPTGRVDRI